MPAPPAERLKIRCYRCNQLLAVAPTKAGTVVACPKCKADLLIPRPEPAATGRRAGGSLGGRAEVGDIPRPGIRDAVHVGDGPAARGGIVVLSRRDRGPHPSRAGRAAARGPARRGRVLRDDHPRAGAGADSAGRRGPVPVPRRSIGSRPAPAALGRRDGPRGSIPVAAAYSDGGGLRRRKCRRHATAPARDLPPCRKRTSRSRRSRSRRWRSVRAADAEPRSIQQVVLPASVVLAWSMFVLAAIPMAFLAGLMIGHFIWKNGP